MAGPRCPESGPELIGDRMDRLKDQTWLLILATYGLAELPGELSQSAIAEAACALHDELTAREAELDRQGVK